MTQRTCSIEGCTRPLWARGWCNSHYKLWRHNGFPSKRPLMKDGPCSVEGCGRPAVKRTWCGGHYRRWAKTGDVQPNRPLRRVSPSIVDGRRQCNRCDQWQPLAQYTKREAATCLSCRRERQRTWADANPDYWRKWQRANPEKVNASVQMRRAARLVLPAERIDRDVVFERDGFTCLLCFGLLDMSAPKCTPFAPTIDHIIPLSKGGHHTYENVQAAHFRCNTAKGNRVA